MAEFCPRCSSPLESSKDSDRLCEVCGWFGDCTEVKDKPPKPDTINPVLAVAQCLSLFRDVCRLELMAEQIYDAGNAVEEDIRKARADRQSCAQSIIALFNGFYQRAYPQKAPAAAKVPVKRAASGMVPWPEEWADRRYNGGGNEPCDMLVGPCACGAWHSEDEDWVRAVLEKHNAEIVDE